MVIVELVGVSKRYRHRGPMVIDDARLRLEAGSLTQVRGTNGSGKSTLLRLVGGFSRPTRGTVRAGYRSLGYVPDRVLPPARMSGRSWLGHLGRLAGATSSAPVAEEVTQRLGLEPGLDTPLGTLSRGNLRKVVVTQALMRPADLIVMDEPFTALDAAARAELATLVAERLADGTSFLVATHTHDLGSTGRTLALDAGRLSETTESITGPYPPPLVAIDLNQPHPTEPDGAPGSAGTFRYLVPPDRVAPFLQAALTSRVRVLRLNPLDPPQGR